MNSAGEIDDEKLCEFAERFNDEVPDISLSAAKLIDDIRIYGQRKLQGWERSILTQTKREADRARKK